MPEARTQFDELSDDIGNTTLVVIDKEIERRNILPMNDEGRAVVLAAIRRAARFAMSSLAHLHVAGIDIRPAACKGALETPPDPLSP